MSAVPADAVRTAGTSVDAARTAEDRTEDARTVDDGTLVVRHPGTGEVVGRHRRTPVEELPEVVARAREAQAWWASLGFGERRRRLLRWRALIAHRLPEVASLLHAEVGKPVADGIVEGVAALTSLDWAARHARRVLRPRRLRRSLVAVGTAARVEYVPYGVVGVIGPWNFPVLTPMNAIAYALAAGNAVVHKPSEYTPGVGRWLADTLAEVVGEHAVLQVVHGDGVLGEALCRAGLDKISFTGSTATASKVMAACATTLTPVTIEAGGKDAMIVDADTDLDLAADACAWGALHTTGQVCVSLERVFVVDAVYDDFLARLVPKVAAVTAGGATADIGPVTTPAQLEVIRRHVTDALQRGARALVGGADAVEPPYAHPTLLVDVPADALVMREETFGPVITVTRVRDVDEAVLLANDTPYGLGGAVFGRRRARAVARRLVAGMVSVNDVVSYAGVPSAPWGGMGASGFGRLRGAEGLREFTRPRSVAERRMPEPLPTRTFRRHPKAVPLMTLFARLRYGRGWRPRR